MGTLKQTLNDVLGKRNILLRRTLPRPATLFARSYFKNQPLKVVEIGTFEGANASSMLKNLNIHTLNCVDPYMVYEQYRSDGSFERVKALRKRSHSIINSLSSRTNARVVWIEEFSDKAAPNFLKESMDFIYIDGNYTYSYVKKDIELYFSKVKNGGIIAGHDIEFEEVGRAVMEFAVKKNLKVYIKSPDWIIVKPK